MAELPRKRYRAVDNKWMFREAQLIEGSYYDPHEGWVEARNKELVADTLVKSGSIFEIAASKARERIWFLEGTVAPFDQVLHFDLEQSFDPQQVLTLNLYSIFTWEDIATELDAVIPGTEFRDATARPQSKPLRDLLGELCGNDLSQVNGWIEHAKQRIKEA